MIKIQVKNTDEYYCLYIYTDILFINYLYVHTHLYLNKAIKIIDTL